MNKEINALLGEYVERTSKLKIRNKEEEILKELEKLNATISEDYEPTNQEMNTIKAIRKEVFSLSDKILKGTQFNGRKKH